MEKTVNRKHDFQSVNWPRTTSSNSASEDDITQRNTYVHSRIRKHSLRARCALPLDRLRLTSEIYTSSAKFTIHSKCCVLDKTTGGHGTSSANRTASHLHVHFVISCYFWPTQQCRSVYGRPLLCGVHRPNAMLTVIIVTLH